MNNTTNTNSGKRSTQVPEFLQALGIVILTFIVIVLGATALSFVIAIVLKIVGRHLTSEQVVTVSTFLTRAAGLLGAIACFTALKQYTLWASALGGALAGPIAYSLITKGANPSSAGLGGAIILGALVGAGLAKRSPRKVAAGSNANSGT